MITWLKLHHEVIHDIRMRRFTAQEKWAWIVLLVVASENKDCRGVITSDNEDLADICEFNSSQDWLYFRDKLIAKGLIEINELGQIEIVNWAEMQAQKPSDRPEATRERKRRQRAKQKQVVAEMSRDVTRDAEMSRAGHATDIDIDQDIDQKKSEKESAHAKIENAKIELVEPIEICEVVDSVEPIYNGSGQEKSQGSGQIVPGRLDPRLLSLDLDECLAAEIPLYPHPAAVRELMMDRNYRPWRNDAPEVRHLFLEFVVSDITRKGESRKETRAIATKMLCKADHAQPGTKDYQQMHRLYCQFRANALKASSIEDVMGHPVSAFQKRMMDRVRQVEAGGC